MFGWLSRRIAVERACLWHAPHHARGGLWQSRGWCYSGVQLIIAANGHEEHIFCTFYRCVPKYLGVLPAATLIYIYIYMWASILEYVAYTSHADTSNGEFSLPPPLGFLRPFTSRPRCHRFFFCTCGCGCTTRPIMKKEKRNRETCLKRVITARACTSV